MASLQSNSTFSVKHHLTGEAFLAWYMYTYRTYVHYVYIAKNWHLNIVLQAELYLRTGTYDRPKNTLAIACPGDVPGPLPCLSPGDRRLSPYGQLATKLATK